MKIQFTFKDKTISLHLRFIFNQLNQNYPTCDEVNLDLQRNP